MTDNQDSGAAMDKQDPPTDRPLTAGDVPLLREGDIIRGPNGKTYRFEEWGDGGFLTFIDEPYDGFLATLCTFVSRPATSAASEGEKADLIEQLCEAMQDGVGCTPWSSSTWDRDGGVSRGLVRDSVHRILSRQAALASPPVSERERELEGVVKAFKKAADPVAIAINRAVNAGPSSAVRLTQAEAMAVIAATRRALTAQPAGEGK